MPRVKTIKREFIDALKRATLQTITELERKYMGRRGVINALVKGLSSLGASQRPQAGKAINELKSYIQKAIEKKRSELQRAAPQSLGKGTLDLTLPGKRVQRGRLHPLTLVQERMVSIFKELNFSVVEGPEVETEWYNFDALNMPKGHPAREMWDTFWINSKLKTQNSKLLLRTHTSPVQVRYMEKHNPPLRIVVPGRVFRYEASDATHDIQFYNLEGLMVDKSVSIANFKAVLETFFERLFGKEFGGMRLRPSFFPFTEPSFEVDYYWKRKRQWLELMGAGMVHPHVFKAAGFASGEWQGFAFGMGVDRIAMMKYNIPDIRLFYSGDLRFIRQF